MLLEFAPNILTATVQARSPSLLLPVLVCPAIIVSVLITVRCGPLYFAAKLFNLSFLEIGACGCLRLSGLRVCAGGCVWKVLCV